MPQALSTLELPLWTCTAQIIITQHICKLDVFIEHLLPGFILGPSIGLPHTYYRTLTGTHGLDSRGNIKGIVKSNGTTESEQS